MINDIETYNTTFEEEGYEFDVQITMEIAGDEEVIDSWIDWIDPFPHEPNESEEIARDPDVREEFRLLAIEEYTTR